MNEVILHRPHHGLALPAHKQAARNVSIAVARVPDELVLLLDQHADAVLQPCVQVGEFVRMGQVIALAASPLGACLHSPVSGQVQSIEPRPTPRAADATTPAIIISNDHRDERAASCVIRHDWSTLSPLALCEYLAQGGLAGLGGAVFPSATKLAGHREHSIDCLLINGVECEPYICCDDLLMRERAEVILQGVQIMLHAAQAAHCKFAIEADKPEALAAMRTTLQTLADTRIELAVVPVGYPGGDEGQLIRRLLSREVPRNGLPRDIGVIVHNVATAYAAAQWLLHGQPLISRIVTVTGPGVASPANFEVRIGTPLSALLAACGNTQTKQPPDMLVMGGGMMGKALRNDEFPIIKASNCLLVAATTALKPPTVELPCIRCGECAEACPVNLLPQMLLLQARSGNTTALTELGLADCIECGCCDYVCPSHITLAARFHEAKHLTTIHETHE